MQVRMRKTAAPMQVGQDPAQAVLQKEKTIPVAQVALVVSRAKKGHCLTKKTRLHHKTN